MSDKPPALDPTNPAVYRAQLIKIVETERLKRYPPDERGELLAWLIYHVDGSVLRLEDLAVSQSAVNAALFRRDIDIIVQSFRERFAATVKRFTARFDRSKP